MVDDERWRLFRSVCQADMQRFDAAGDVVVGGERGPQRAAWRDARADAGHAVLEFREVRGGGGGVPESGAGCGEGGGRGVIGFTHRSR